MWKVARIASFACFLCLVAGCGPRTIKSMLFPLRYTVESKLTYEYGGQVHTQTLNSRCVVRDVSDSINNVPFTTDRQGDNHWIRLGHGAVLLLPIGPECSWQTSAPMGAALDDSFPQFQRDTLWFENGHAPTKILTLSTPQLWYANTGYPRLLSHVVTIVPRRRPTLELSEVIPVLYPAEQDQMSLQRDPARRFIGVTAAVVDCTTKNTRPVQGGDGKCRYPDLDPPVLSDLHSVVGYLPVDSDASLQRFVVARGGGLQPLVKNTLYSAAHLSADGFGKLEWRPELCFGRRCAPVSSEESVWSGATFDYRGKEWVLMLEPTQLTLDYPSLLPR